MYVDRNDTLFPLGLGFYKQNKFLSSSCIIVVVVIHRQRHRHRHSQRRRCRGHLHRHRYRSLGGGAVKCMRFLLVWLCLSSRMALPNPGTRNKFSIHSYISTFYFHCEATSCPISWLVYGIVRDHVTSLTESLKWLVIWSHSRWDPGVVSGNWLGPVHLGWKQTPFCIHYQKASWTRGTKCWWKNIWNCTVVILAKSFRISFFLDVICSISFKSGSGRS